ncbi:MAG TPA: GNAT family N-acetyltransferase [Candidatus Limnocylindria bacterium]|nr:GNAT family N-acetyltransferase [Candidatus Limnocylindria bacterium]
MLTSATGVSHHLERQLAAAAAGERGYAFVAERDGAVVGAALLSSEPAFPGSVITLISVSGSARKSGVASALADLLEERLVHETLPASCRLRDDLFEGRRFAERHGFTLHGHSMGWSIDLAAREETLEKSAREARQAAGVRVRRADLPQEIGRVLECAARCMPGLPAEQEADPEQARDYFPGNAIVLLAESDKPGGERLALGLTAVAPQVEGDAWYTLFTGVDPAHRRTGIARALKTESFLQARRAGAQSVLTHNHDTNDAIIGLNTAFGMQPAPGYWELQRPVRG